MLTKEYWDSLTDQEKWDWAFNASVELAEYDEYDECADDDDDGDIEEISLPNGAWTTMDSSIWEHARSRVPIIPDDDEDMTYD